MVLIARYLNIDILVLRSGPDPQVYVIFLIIVVMLIETPLMLQGLALALSLLRNGISVRIIEKEAQFIVGQRGCGLMVSG